MFGTYLRRELGNRKRQTLIVAVGMAVAIALVMTVSAVSAGVKDSQDEVLGSLYGIGTDISVTMTSQPGEGEAGRPRFDFDAEAGTNADGTRTIDTTRLEVQRSVATFDTAAVGKVRAVDGVATVAVSLALNNTTFKGELPEFRVFGGGDTNRPAPGQQGQGTTAGSVPVTAATPTTLPAPTGGADGRGGSSFEVTTFTVMGVDPAVTDAGPLSATKVTAGRALAAADKGKRVASVDAGYAATEEIEVGDTVLVAKKKFKVVGLVASDSSASTTAANVFVPLDVAQELSSSEDLVTNIYVTADSGDQVNSVSVSLGTLLPDATVSTTAELASSVSGSLSTASDLLGTLGWWLSVIVLVVAFVVATLLTVSGVSRRTREFGTLKAIGWRNRRIVGQVAGESIVQGSLGGLAGVGLGFAAIAVFNRVAPVLEASTAGLTRPQFAGGGPFGGGGGPAAAARAAANTYEVVLSATTRPATIATAVALAVLGGVVAGAFGGLRAARLRPAEAMRSVA